MKEREMNLERKRSSIEPLESRRLLNSDFAWISGTGTLLVFGDADDNVINVTVGSDTATANRDGEELSFSAVGVKRIRVEAGSGNDRVIIAAPRPCTLLGEEGSDILTGGSGDDSIDGGEGDDVFDGGLGDDFLGGGDGFDTAEYFGRDIRFVFGFDMRRDDAALPPEPFTEHTPYGSAGAPSTDEGDTIGYFVESIGGTSKGDTFQLGVTGDIARVFDGRGGDDFFGEIGGDEFLISEFTLIGGAGDDHFIAENLTRDSIFAGSGDDIISVNEGSHENHLPEFLDAGAGHDLLGLGTRTSIVFDMRLSPGLEDVRGIGIHAPTTVIGNDLPNHLVAAEPHPIRFPVTLYGMAGNDTLEGGFHGDALFGGDGDDLLIGGLGNDTLRGEGGNDALGGNAGADKLFGHSGNDAFNGGSGNDRLYGDTGVDTFVGGTGNDTFFARDNIAEGLHGGTGQDSAQHDSGLDALFSVEDVLT